MCMSRTSCFSSAGGWGSIDPTGWQSLNVFTLTRPKVPSAVEPVLGQSLFPLSEWNGKFGGGGGGGSEVCGVCVCVCLCVCVCVCVLFLLSFFFFFFEFLQVKI